MSSTYWFTHTHLLQTYTRFYSGFYRTHRWTLTSEGRWSDALLWEFRTTPECPPVLVGKWEQRPLSRSKGEHSPGFSTNPARCSRINMKQNDKYNQNIVRTAHLKVLNKNNWWHRKEKKLTMIRSMLIRLGSRRVTAFLVRLLYRSADSDVYNNKNILQK
jgi:hypothetical protein